MKMMERIISSILLCAMLVSVFPVRAFAEEENAGAAPLETEEQAAASETDNLRFAHGVYTSEPDYDSEELYLAYAEKLFYGSDRSVFGSAAGETLTGDEKILYDAVVPFIRQIANGERTSATISIGQEAVIDGVTYAVDREAVFTGTDFTTEMLGHVVDALLADLPYEMYWYEKTTGCAMSYIVGSRLIQVILYFTVADNYASGEFVANPAKTGVAAAAAANARNIVNAYASASDYDKLAGYRDEICALVSYDHAAADGGYFDTDIDPWQLISVFDGNSSTNVVCEGYSKAFMYLCDQTSFLGNVSCYTVTGALNGGAHMWNIADMNGKHYLVDVTNSDSGTAGEIGGLFLAGGQGSAAEGYRVAGLSFVYSSDTLGIWGTGTDSILTLESKDYDPEGTGDNNLTWTLTDGVLTVSGTGAMEDYAGNPPWYNYRESIHSAVIQNGVTRIGARALFGCSHLTELVIPNSVTSIGIDAFRYCNTLTDVYYGGTGEGWEVLGEYRPAADYIHYGCTDAENHWSETVVEATCTSAGSTTHSCSCGYRYYDDYVNALGHDMGQWTVSREATCAEEGERHRNCSRCSYIETEAIEKTAHSDEAVETDPTCTEQGYTTHTCSVCGYSYVDSYKDALGHSMGVWENTEGNEWVRKCSRENCSYEETKTVVPHEHSYESVITAPTCTEQGYTTHTCSVCGEGYMDTFVDALGHSEAEAVIENETAATCEADGGSDSVVYCTVCEAELSRETAVIPALGHSFGEWYEVTPATPTAKGEERRDCSRCDAFETREVEQTEYTEVLVGSVLLIQNENGTYTATPEVTGGTGSYAFTYWLFNTRGEIVDLHANTYDTSWTFDAPAAPGQYLVRAYATDFTSGMYEDSAWVQMGQLEDVKVRYVHLSSRDGQMTATPEVTGGSGSKAFTYWMFNPRGEIVDMHANTYDTSWTFETPAEPGMYLVRAYATDFVSGEYADTAWFHVGSGSEVTVSFLTLRKNADGSITATPQVSGGSGSYAFTYWMFNTSGEIVQMNANTYDTSWTFRVPDNKQYLIRAYATDFVTGEYNDTAWFVKDQLKTSD